MKYTILAGMVVIANCAVAPTCALAQSGSSQNDSVTVPRRGSAAEIERLGQKVQQALQVNWFGGGQALSAIEGCQLTVQSTRTVEKISALTVYRFDAGQLGDSITTRDNDAPSMVSSVRFVRRDGMRFVARDSSQIRGGAAPTDSLDYLEIGAAYGNPGRRLESMIAALVAFRSVCEIVRTP